MRILCIASPGGHLEQMLQCLDAFEGHEVVLASYDWSTLRDLEDSRITRRVGIFYGGDARISLLVGTILSTFQWVWLLAAYRPQVLFSTGAELAIIPFWLGRVFLRARTIFLETAVRQDSPSRTGHLVYPVCNALFVQAQAVLKHYGPKAHYAGRLL